MKIVINIFAAIGVLSSVVFSVTLLLRDASNVQSKGKSEQCISDGSVMPLDSYYDNRGFYYELISHTTGFSDKVTFLKLLKSKYGTVGVYCIEKDKVVLVQDIYWGPEHKPSIQFPISIVVSNEEIDIGYTNNRDQSINLSNIPITWNIK